jgi:hypothetical protein
MLSRNVAHLAERGVRTIPNSASAPGDQLHPVASPVLGHAVKAPEISTSLAVAPASPRTKLIGRSEQAVYPVHVAAGNA